MSEAGERGFTLFEMLVVLAIVGLISGLIWPSLATAVRAQSLRTVAGEAQAALRSARGRAMRMDAPVLLEPSAVGPLPLGVTVSTVPTGGIRFFPDGSSPGGFLDVIGAQHAVRYAVSIAGTARPLSR